MLENKKLNMILSLLIAIALWAFVIGEINPEATRVYRDVPINYLNQETLENEGMAVYSVSDRTINVTLNGTRSEINKVDTKDIVATVDVANATMGENQLRVDLKVPSKVDIETQSVSKVTVTVESRIAKEIPVEVSYEGEFNGEEEPITVDLDQETVTVYGAETKVGTVVAANAVVKENSITAEQQQLECNLVAVNETGQRVYNVDLSSSTVTITSELAKLKTVPLNVPVEGKYDNSIQRTVIVPEEIIIKGKAADLDAVTSITTEPVYLDGVVASTSFPLVPILPEGVEMSEDNDALEVVVQVTKTATKTMTMESSKIALQGLAEGLETEIPVVSIELALTGSETLLNSLTTEQITLAADLNGLGAGRHKVELQAACDVEGVAITLNPKRINVVISETPVDEEAEETDHNKENDNNHESEE